MNPKKHETKSPRGPAASTSFFQVIVGALAGLLLSLPATSEPLRVGTSGDYAPFSVLVVSDGQNHFTGLDPSLARAFARDQAMELEFVPFRWGHLEKDLQAGAFDVAMSGVTVRPERSLIGRFSLPITTSGAVLLVPNTSPYKEVEDLDHNNLAIAVNAGGHLEKVTRSRFMQAQIRSLEKNENVIRALANGEVNAAVTDTREAISWRHNYPGLRAIGPFTRDRKAFLVDASQPELARKLDAWLLRAQADGQFDAILKKELNEKLDTSPVTGPLAALLAAIDERLALMPWIAEVKRASHMTIEAPAIETRVLAAAIDSVRSAEKRNPLSEQHTEAEVKNFYRALIEAAKAVQRQTLMKPRKDLHLVLPDLDEELRPALERISDRIAMLLVALPQNISPEQIETGVQTELISTQLPEKEKRDLAQSLIALTSPHPDEPTSKTEWPPRP